MKAHRTPLATFGFLCGNQVHKSKQNVIAAVIVVLVLAASLPAQSQRLWVLREPGEMAEYDPSTFATRQPVKVPPEALSSPQALLVNRLGQMLFAPLVSLPLAEDDLTAEKKVWFWDGHTATTLTRDVARTTATAGSNLAITESAAELYLSGDGSHLYWFSNEARRLQRDGVDLSTKTTWKAWRTDLTGAARQDLATVSIPDCPCPSGSCDESCPYAEVSTPDRGIDKFFTLTQVVTGKTQTSYQSTLIYEETGGKWNPTSLKPPLRHVLDAVDSSAILEAIPDTACCGWQNQSNDLTLLRLRDSTVTVFDEQLTFKNHDYDVSFFSQNAKLAPNRGTVAITIVASAQPNKPIQLSEQGQADPEESMRIRKALLELPAVEIKTVADAAKRVALLPHATLVGWITDKEILIVDGHLLVAYNVASGARRRSNIRVEDAAHVFLR